MPFNTAPPESVQREVVAAKQSGSSVKEICKAFNLGKSSVYRLLAKQEARLVRHYHPLNLEARSLEICAMYDAGMSARSICEWAGVGRHGVATVYKLLRENGISVRAAGRTSSLRHLAQEASELYAAGKGSPTIARTLGVSKSTVQNLLRINRVSIRDRRSPMVRTIRERDRLVLAHLEYVQCLAVSFLKGRSDIPFDDAKQAAMVASIRAAELWESRSEASFRTYVYKWVKFAVLDLIREAIAHRHYVEP